MNLGEAYARLKQGTLWSATGRCKGYAVLNPGEASKIDQYVAALDAGLSPAPPALATATGQGIVGMLAALGGGAPPPDPVPAPGGAYFSDVFRDGDYRRFLLVFAAYGTNPNLKDWGGLPGAPNQYGDPVYPGPGQNIHDPGLRVSLVTPPKPTPRGAQWVSRQELRADDPPWYPGSTLDKSTTRLDAQQTWGGPFTWGMERWFRFAIYLPDDFAWAANNFHTLFSLHTTASGRYEPNMLTIRSASANYGQNPLWIGWAFEGATDGSEFRWLPLVQITNADGTRRLESFNRWYTFLLGLRASDKADGWREVYLDGKQVMARTPGANTRTGDDGQYAAWQNYKLHAAALALGARRSAILFGDHEIGKTKAEVA